VSTVTSLPADTLTVDPGVQRPLDERRVDRMALDLHTEALGVIAVSQRADGTYHVIDGQHRVASVRRAGRGADMIRCVVYTGLTRAEEASMFLRLNESRRVQAIDRFRVRVVEGDLVAVSLTTILADHGWRVTPSDGDGAFTAVAALETIYRGANITPDSAHADACHALLNIITTAYGHATDGVRKEIIGGLGLVILRHGHELDTHKIVTELAKTSGGPLGLISRAKGLRDLRGGRIDHAMAEVIVNLHNKSRRSRRLADWRAA
jgi:hypothetical protein